MRLDLLPARSRSGAFHVVVEAPKGASVKLKYDPELRIFVYSRALVSGLHYPFDWGFVPSTLAPDGDPLDAAVLVQGASAVGAVVACRAMATLRVSQRDTHGDGRVRNDRVIGVPASDPLWEDIHGLSSRQRAELEVFFTAAGALEGKDLRLEGWGEAAAADQQVDRAAALGQRG